MERNEVNINSMLQFDKVKSEAVRKTRKIAKRALGVVGIRPNSGVEIKSSNWILKRAEGFENQTKRDVDVKISSDVERVKSYVQRSMEIECAINELVNSGKYTFNNMLVIKNPYQNSPLTALAIFRTKKKCSVKVTVLGKTKDCNISYQISEGTNHRIPIMGLYADYENTIEIELIKESTGKTVKRTFKLNVAPLKGKNSKIKIVKELSKNQYLYNLTLVYGGGDDGIYPYAFDRNGDMRFVFSMAPKTYGFQPISNGRFLFLNKKIVRLTATNPAAIQLFEVDQMGRFHRLYNIEKGSHHDFVETEKGNFVVGSNVFEGNTFEDMVLEIDRKTGNIVNEIRIKDYIDKKYITAADWAHLNSIQYNEEEKTVMLSLRNLHAVVKINYEKKELVWILGNPEFWEGSSVADKVLKPEGDMQWFFQAHAAYFLDADLDDNSDTKQMIIYDNHTQARKKVGYYDNSKDSFVRIYTIDEKLKTVSMLKSFSCNRSSIRSNSVYEHEAGRVLAMSGKVKDDNGNKFKGEIIEFDYSTGEILNMFAINHGYYRAYEFKFEFDDMAKPMKIDKNYSLGKIYEMNECTCPDISTAKELPALKLEEKYKNEEERKNKLADFARKNPDYYVDPEQDMVRVQFKIEDDVMCVSLIDHLLEGIYFVGKNHTYLRDFTETKQERPEYFARTPVTDPIPLSNLEEDEYKVYLKHSIGLYKTECSVKIEKK